MSGRKHRPKKQWTTGRTPSPKDQVTQVPGRTLDRTRGSSCLATSGRQLGWWHFSRCGKKDVPNFSKPPTHQILVGRSSFQGQHVLFRKTSGRGVCSLRKKSLKSLSNHWSVPPTDIGPSNKGGGRVFTWANLGEAARIFPWRLPGGRLTVIIHV